MWHFSAWMSLVLTAQGTFRLNVLMSHWPLWKHWPTQTHRVPLGAVLPEEYMRPDGGLWVESGSGRLTFLMTLPEVGLTCLLRAVTWHTRQTQEEQAWEFLQEIQPVPCTCKPATEKAVFFFYMRTVFCFFPTINTVCIYSGSAGLRYFLGDLHACSPHFTGRTWPVLLQLLWGSIRHYNPHFLIHIN